MRGHGQGMLRNRRGFTLVEMLAVITLIGILTGIAVNATLSVTSTSRNKQAIADILQIQTRVDEFIMTLDSLPRSLSDVGMGSMRDPWGNAYAYTPFDTDIKRARRDRFLVPINTFYDLYSKGRDGLTTLGLSKPESLDDIVRANDGAFVGLGSQF